jgi:HD-like signal output (HDOD) protein
MSLLKGQKNPSAEKSTSRHYRPLAFADLKDQELVAIYNVSPIKKIAEGAAVTEAESQQDCAYVVMSGSVRLVSKNSTTTLAGLGRGEWFGRLGVSEPLPYRVIAAEPSTVLQITATALQQLSSNVQAAVNVALSNSILKTFRVLAQGVEQTNQKLDALADYTQNLGDGRIELTKAFIGRYVGDIPRLPSAVSDLAVRMLDDRTSPSEVADGIKRDPSLAALVLQTVNSPYYGLRTKIPDYYRACLLLGFNNIYRLVLTKSVQGIMPDTAESREVQQHSYIVSVLAHEIALLSGKVPAPLAATLGLLHDLGHGAVLLFKQRHPELNTSFDLLDKSAVGAGLLAKWELPASIVSVVEQQNRSAYESPEQIVPENRYAIGALYLAHECYELATKGANESSSRMYAKEYLADLGFSHSSLEDFYREKLYPGILADQKCLPDPIRRILSIRNADEQAEQTVEAAGDNVASEG